jgi:small subunit ribosomal protein S1
MASHTSSTKPQSAMAALLAKHKNDIVTLKKGESVKGKLTKLSSSEITVDVGSKTEALVLEKERRILNTILSMFKVGDTVEVNVLNPESEYGQPIVSLRRYLGDLAWKKLEDLQKSKDTLEGTVQDVTKAGYLVSTDFGVAGFLPQSHTSQGNIAAGQSIKVTVLELNRKDNKIIFSQKANLSEEEFTKAIKGLKTGDKVKATITNVSPFGVFVTFIAKDDITLEGFIHISEVSWDKVTDLASMFSQGQEIDAVVIRFDNEAKRVNLSIKRLTADPFESLMEKYPLEKKVTATISKIDESGITLALDEEVEGFIKQEKVPPTSKYAVDQKITATVSEFDKKRHKIILVPVLLEKPIGYR